MKSQIANPKPQIIKCKIRIFALICFLGFFSGCQQPQLYRDSQVCMGTFVEVISPDAQSSRIVFREIKRVEKLLSKYIPESDISRLNQNGKATVSSDTFYVLKMAKEFWQASDGAFDITVGPLLEIWGFKEKKYRLPEPAEIIQTLKLIGTEKVLLDEANNIVTLELPQMRLDLGAIAKGYAVDCAVKELRDNGIKSALINAGGDIYCLGKKFAVPWQIGVKNPFSGGVTKTLCLTDKAVATSGDYEQYFTSNQKTYAHIFNPKTGYPAESGVVSVTVIADDCLIADALATSCFVLGKERGGLLAKKFNAVISDIRIK